MTRFKHRDGDQNNGSEKENKMIQPLFYRDVYKQRKGRDKTG